MTGSFLFGQFLLPLEPATIFKFPGSSSAKSLLTFPEIDTGLKVMSPHYPHVIYHGSTSLSTSLLKNSSLSRVPNPGGSPQNPRIVIIARNCGSHRTLLTFPRMLELGDVLWLP